MALSAGHVRNRGPAAAQENRRALLQAARRLFVERGYQVPLSAIAREAGVGQGVLYRHFGSRLDLALAVFEERFTELEGLAAEGGTGAFRRLWDRLATMIVAERAFIDMVIDARRERPDYDGADRLRALVAPALDEAQRAGEVDERFTVDDVLLAQRMIYGVAATAGAPDEARSRVDRLTELLGLFR